MYLADPLDPSLAGSVVTRRKLFTGRFAFLDAYVDSAASVGLHLMLVICTLSLPVVYFVPHMLSRVTLIYVLYAIAMVSKHLLRSFGHCPYPLIVAVS